MVNLMAVAVLGMAAGGAEPVRVACLGDSITHGGHLPEGSRWPRLLQTMLGNGYEVRNFGVGGATLLETGDRPYVKQAAYARALAFRPDIAIVMLGTNDTCGPPRRNWEKRTALRSSAHSIISALHQRNPHTRVILCAPPDMRTDAPGLSEERRADLKERRPRLDWIRTRLRAIAAAERVEFADMRYTTWGEHRVVDGVHPTEAGMRAIACRAYEAIQTRCDPDFRPALPPDISVRRRTFHGFPCLEFRRDGVLCRIACPSVAARGRPWVWRARFWGHEPQFDLAMLERGFHIAYCDVSNLFGAPVAVERWNEFHRFMTQIGFDPKPVLEGMSRGGLIIHNWAAANPDKVAGIYADNAVLDIKSWPGGLGRGPGSRQCWHDCMRAYGFADEDAARAWKGNPLDHLEVLARARIPILYLIGTADSVVPPAENAEIAIRQLRRLGGVVNVIRKPGLDHHPHSLPDPAPIVRFALSATGRLISCPDKDAESSAPGKTGRP